MAFNFNENTFDKILWNPTLESSSGQRSVTVSATSASMGATTVAGMTLYQFSVDLQLETPAWVPEEDIVLSATSRYLNGWKVSNMGSHYIVSFSGSTYSPNEIVTFQCSYSWNSSRYAGEEVNNVVFNDNLVWTNDLYNYSLQSDNTYAISAKNPSAISGEITLPSTHNGIVVSAISEDGFEDCLYITKVTIPPSIQSLGHYSFYGCTGLTEINIPQTVTYIGDEILYGCTSLSTLDVGSPLFDFDIEGTIYNCPITTLTLRGKIREDLCLTDLETVTSAIFRGVQVIPYELFIGGALTSVSFDNTLRVIEDGAFSYCADLESVHIPESVEYIGLEAFVSCSSLTEMTFEHGIWVLDGYGAYDFSISSRTPEATADLITTYQGYWEKGCYSFTENSDGYYTVDKLDTTSLQGTVFLPTHYEDIPVRTIGDFSQCDYIEELAIPNSYRNWPATSGFYHCSNLRSVTISNGLTSIGDFGYCTSLESISIPASVTNIIPYAFSNCSALEEVVFTYPVWEEELEADGGSDSEYRYHNFGDSAEAASRLVNNHTSSWFKFTVAKPTISTSVTNLSGYDRLAVTITNPNNLQGGEAFKFDIYVSFSGANTPASDTATGYLGAGGSTTITFIPQTQSESDTTFESCTITAHFDIYPTATSVTTAKGSEYAEEESTTTAQ